VPQFDLILLAAIATAQKFQTLPRIYVYSRAGNHRGAAANLAAAAVDSRSGAAGPCSALDFLFVHEVNPRTKEDANRQFCPIREPTPLARTKVGFPYELRALDFSGRIVEGSGGISEEARFQPGPIPTAEGRLAPTKACLVFGLRSFVETLARRTCHHLRLRPPVFSLGVRRQGVQLLKEPPPITANASAPRGTARGRGAAETVRRETPPGVAFSWVVYMRSGEFQLPPPTRRGSSPLLHPWRRTKIHLSAFLGPGSQLVFKLPARNWRFL